MTSRSVPTASQNRSKATEALGIERASKTAATYCDEHMPHQSPFVKSPMRWSGFAMRQRMGQPRGVITASRPTLCGGMDSVSLYWFHSFGGPSQWDGSPEHRALC